MTYDVDYFIKKFEAIPESNWCIGNLNNGCGQRCALGHTLRYNTDEYAVTEATYALRKMFRKKLLSVASVNNGNDDCYTQSSPKKRILAALYDIKKVQNPEPEKPKEISIDYSQSVPVTFEQIKKDIPVYSN